MSQAEEITEHTEITEQTKNADRLDFCEFRYFRLFRNLALSSLLEQSMARRRNTFSRSSPAAIDRADVFAP